MRNYRDILVWQKAHQFTLKTYTMPSRFTLPETYSLADQLKRASYSIPMNIAEGCGKTSDADMARYLDIASGSASEVDYQVLLAKDLGLIDESLYKELHNEITIIRKMLTSFIKELRKRNKKPNHQHLKPNL